ncbi:MAG TPA: alkaline phosphatase family protein [Candidatus Acidoferrales bacterium]|nr:alkaline phosphatase family protein [Candidatus Acidoferrales bacterium]
MSAGLNALRHIVVLMMENRSFDHMLGSLKAENPAIDGLTGAEWNPDTTGTQIRVQPLADYQGQLDPDPDHHFPGVDWQIFGGQTGPNRQANMQGFIQDYYRQQQNVDQSHKILYYFTADKLPVLSSLARQFVVFNGWFSSIPGPTICNRAFAHYGTSFGQVGMDIFYWKTPPYSIYERALLAGRTARIYYYDGPSSTMEIVNLLKNQPKIFGTFDQFLADCKSGDLPDYSFVEPNYNDHDGPGGEELASDQHPDHNVQQGERFIGMVYNAIFNNEQLWNSTALLVVYDEHGGIYDHVVPPACIPDGFSASADATGTAAPFAFNRLGVRVPAVLVSPWVHKGLVVPGPYQPNGRTFEHASLPATVMKWMLANLDLNALAPADRQKFLQATPREKAADTFLDLLTDDRQPDGDCPSFDVS